MLDATAQSKAKVSLLELVVSMLLPAWWHGELGHGEAPALPPEPVQAFHPDPQPPQPLDLVQDGPETLVQRFVGLRKANQTPLAPPLLIRQRCKNHTQNCL